MRTGIDSRHYIQRLIHLFLKIFARYTGDAIRTAASGRQRTPPYLLASDPCHPQASQPLEFTIFTSGLFESEFANLPCQSRDFGSRNAGGKVMFTHIVPSFSSGKNSLPQQWNN